MFLVKKSAYSFGMGSVSLRIRANGHTGWNGVTGKEGTEYSASSLLSTERLRGAQSGSLEDGILSYCFRGYWQGDLTKSR